MTLALSPQRARIVSARLATALAGLGIVTGFALAHQFSAGRDAVTDVSGQPVGARSDTAAGPTHVDDGIPSGFSRTRAGAISAAAAYVTTGQALLDLDPLSAEQHVQAMAASASADQFVSDTMRQLASARESLAGGSGPTVFRQAAVAYRVDAFDRDRARVAIWNVGVLTREGIAPPQAGWATSTFDLVWERGDWRIWAETIVPGPAPVLNNSTVPATSGQFIGTLEGFVDFARHA